MYVNNLLTKSRLGLNQTPTIENIIVYFFLPPSLLIDIVYLTQLLRECRIIVGLILIRTSCKMYSGRTARVVVALKSVNDTYFQRTARRVAPATKPLYLGARWR